MARFSSAPVLDVISHPRKMGPSLREQTRQVYHEAVQDTLPKGEALVIELESGDKPITIRNRINRAVSSLGLEGVRIRRRRDKIYVYIA